MRWPMDPVASQLLVRPTQERAATLREETPQEMLQLSSDPVQELQSRCRSALMAGQAATQEERRARRQLQQSEEVPVELAPIRHRPTSAVRYSRHTVDDRRSRVPALRERHSRL